MACTITISLVEESVQGDIGDDWKYSITATARDPEDAITGTGRISVAEHVLKPGTAQPPPTPAGVKISGGECGTRVHVELAVQATEVDWLVDDPASQKVLVAIECPGAGKPPVTSDASISVKVRESPQVLRGEATFQVRLRLTATCL
jgi:hypothetical protein